MIFLIIILFFFYVNEKYSITHCQLWEESYFDRLACTLSVISSHLACIFFYYDWFFMNAFAVSTDNKYHILSTRKQKPIQTLESLQGCVYFSVIIFDHDDDSDDSRRISFSKHLQSSSPTNGRACLQIAVYWVTFSFMCITKDDCDSEATEKIKRLCVLSFFFTLLFCYLPNLVSKTNCRFYVAIITRMIFYMKIIQFSM